MSRLCELPLAFTGCLKSIGSHSRTTICNILCVMLLDINKSRMGHILKLQSSLVVLCRIAVVLNDKMLTNEFQE